MTFADGRRETGPGARHRPDLDLAVLEVDTGDAPRSPGSRATRRASARRCSLSRTPAGAACGSRSASSPPRGGASGAREAAASGRRSSTPPPLPRGLLRRTARGRRRAPPRDERAPPRRRPDPGRAGRRGGAQPRCRWPGATPSRPRLGVAVAPPRAARRMRRAVGLPERDGLLVRAVEDRSPAGGARGLEPGDLPGRRRRPRAVGTRRPLRGPRRGRGRTLVPLRRPRHRRADGGGVASREPR